MQPPLVVVQPISVVQDQQPAQPLSAQNPYAARNYYTNSQPQPTQPGKRQWQSEWSDCCSDYPSCLVAAFCPCFIFATLRVRDQLHGVLSSDFWVCVLTYGFWYFLLDLLDPLMQIFAAVYGFEESRRWTLILDLLEIIAWIAVGHYTSMLRRTYRQRHNIVEAPCHCCSCEWDSDSCHGFWLGCCALAQVKFPLCIRRFKGTLCS